MKKKILLLCFSLFVIITLTVSIIFQQMMKDNYIQSIVSSGVSNAKLIHLLLEENPNADKYLFKLSQSFSKKTGFRITFIREDGIPIADSDDNSILFYDFNDLPSFKSTQKNINSYYIENNTSTDIPTIKIFVKTKFYNRKSAIIMLSKDLSLFHDFQKKTIFIILSGIFFSGVISILFALYFTDRIIKPITQLNHFSKEISHGNFNTKVSVKSHDELEELAKSFHIMQQKIKILLKDIESRAKNLQSILDHLSEGILVLNFQGNIILINDFAKKEFSLQNSYPDFFSYPEFHFLKTEIKNILNHKKNFHVKKKVGKNIYQIHSHIIQNPQQIVIVFQNVTLLEENENLRREFVANASHELKTPLTILSGFIETIKLGHIKDDAQFNHILDIMEKETERLNSLANNLLHLSHLENPIFSGKEVPHYSFSLLESIQSIIELYQDMIQEKKLSLETKIEDTLLSSTISKEWLRIVLGNLLENAVKYSTIDSKIILCCSIKNESLILSVQDFGCGIALSEQNKIFQRFYRIDPSRNHQIKGNGLGLAIVKNMVEKEKGSIRVESELGKGSLFFVTIPIKKENISK